MMMINAVKAVYEDLEELLVFSLISFVPVANLVSLGRAIKFEVEKTHEPYRTSLLAYLGFLHFLLVVIFAFPLYFLLKLSYTSAIAYFAIIFPILAQMLYKISFYDGIKGILDIHFSLRYWLMADLSLTIYAFFILLHAIVPVFGWISIIYAPLAVWHSIHGNLYRSFFGL